MTRVAHTYQLATDVVDGWTVEALAAAVNSITRDAERCTGCNIHPDDGWHVAAQIEHCPTCHDVDVQQRALQKQGGGKNPPPPGQRVKWATAARSVSARHRFGGPEGLAPPPELAALAQAAHDAGLRSTP